MNTPINHLTAGFIGLGLIGGSIARGLKRSAPDIQIMAYMRTREKLEQAHADGIVDLILDGVDEHLSECDIIFLCTPVEFNESYLRQIRPFLKEGAVVTDVGSTKTSIHETVAALGMESCFVGGHPMAGSEKTGYESSTDHLLENAYYIITPTPHTPASYTDRMVEVAKAIGALPLVLDYHRHDFIVAAISHLPHLIASSLVNLVHDCDSEDQMMKRLAASVSQYMSASSIVTEQTRKQSAGVVNELSVNLDHYFDMVRNSFEYIANNSTVQEELESDEPYKSDGTELYSYYSRSGQIRRLLLQGYTSIYMNDIQLYGYNGANHLLANNHEINENTAQTSCELAEQAKGRCIYYNASEEGLMYMAKQIKDSLTMKPVGILRASIKLSYLKKMTITARDSLAAHIFLLDNDKNVLIESAENDATISDRSWIEKISGNTGEFLFTADGQGYDCVYQRSSDTGLTVVGMIPMSFLQKTARGLQKTTIMLILASLMLCIFLANILAKGIAGPIKRTSKAMQQFAEGDFSVRLPEGRRDEIGAMNSVFNQTIEKIEQLIKQVVEMETVNKDIEFQALQAQINPHFLYNVLDTINWMARKKGEDNICRMVTSISSLMRASISNKRSMVYIREEIKYVQDYLYIQETRYGDKFTSYIEVDERLNELEIPKMTIQTLVENAVVHGVENATWDCFLYVSGEITDGMAVFTVKDDGVGMSQEQLEKLMGTEEEPDHEAERTHTHLGVYAVRKRLDYVYQNKARMSITSEPGKGTQVILEIPMNGNVGVTYRKCDEPVNENNKKRGDER